MQISFQRARIELFSGKVLTIDGSLDLGRSGVVLVEGANGTGKTMLLNVLAKTLGDGDAGPIDSVDATAVRLFDRPGALRVGRVRQDPRENFISRCSSDEIILPLLHPGLSKDDASKRIDEVLAQCDVTDEALLRRSIDKLSSGQQQLLAACVAVAPSPGLLLLDEPFERLDPEASAKVARLIRATADQALVLIATHRAHDLLAKLELGSAPTILVERRNSQIRLEQGHVAATKTDPDGPEVPATAEVASSTPRRLRLEQGLGEATLTCERLELWIDKRLLTFLLDVRITRGYNTLVGANAAGKTFLGEVLSGRVPLNPLWGKSGRFAKGEVKLPGTSDGRLKSWRNRGVSAFVPATPDLWLPERSVAEELQDFHGNGLDSGALEVLASAGIQPDTPISQLSFGQKRLVVLAALPRTLELLVLDEPFADLSASSESVVKALIDDRVSSGEWASVVLTSTGRESPRMEASA